MRSLFYAGPSITRLHQDYAKRGRIEQQLARGRRLS
jgi:hypothetical protein